MLFTPWHFVHSCATTSLPTPSGRSAAPPFLCPATGAIDQAKTAAAASIPSEIFDMSPPLPSRSQVRSDSRVGSADVSGVYLTPTRVPRAWGLDADYSAVSSCATFFGHVPFTLRLAAA